MSSCQIKTSQQHDSSFGNFRSAKAHLPAITITEQPMLLTKGKINRPGHKFSKYFRFKMGSPYCRFITNKMILSSKDFYHRRDLPNLKHVGPTFFKTTRKQAVSILSICVYPCFSFLLLY